MWECLVMGHLGFLSPIYFIYILLSLIVKNTCWILKKCTFLYVVDNLKHWVKINLLGDYRKFNNDLDNFVQWIKLIGSSLNIANFKVMMYTRHVSPLYCSYNIPIWLSVTCLYVCVYSVYNFNKSAYWNNML